MNPTRTTFRSTARRVLHRWLLARWLSRLARTSVPVFVTVAATVVLLRLTGLPWGGPVAAGGVIALWLTLTLGRVWLTRPGPVAVFAHWDRLANRDEMFVSAYCFESRDDLSPGQQLHVNRASAHLADEQDRLARQWPIALPHRTWLMPVVFVLVVIAAVLWPGAAAFSGPGDLPDPARLDEMSRQLDKHADQLDPLKGLTPDQKKKIQELKSSLKDTSRRTKELAAKGPKGVLGELEDRARQAEALAAELGDASADPLSSEMLSEMERHADTAPLADAIRAQELKKMSAEAGKIGNKLQSDQLTQRAQHRVKEAFKRVLQKADAADKQTRVGKTMDESHKHLDADRPVEAGEAFNKLAKTYDLAAQRRQASQKLADLAKRLRQAAAGMFNPNQGGMQRLQTAQGNPNGLRPMQLGQMQQGSQLQQALSQMPMGQAGAPTPAAPMVAGTGQMMPGQGQVPVPGSGPMPGQGQAPIPGSGQMPGQGQGQSPVPGSGMGQGRGAGQGAGAGMSAGSMPGPGAGVGGLFAGHGTAPLGAGATKAKKATGSDVVAARPVGKGPDQVRNVEAEHTEKARRAARDLAVRTIRAEEEALNQESIPLTRREQIKTYFDTLRKHFDK